MRSLVHPGLECGREPSRPGFERVRGEADEVEVPLHEVEDHLLPNNLSFRVKKRELSNNYSVTQQVIG